MKRSLKIIISIFVLCILAFNAEKLSTKLFSEEYRELRKTSEAHSIIVTNNLRSALNNNPSEILIKNLTAFDWDYVCLLSDRTIPRTSVKHKNYLNKDYPVLSGFGRINGSALVFANDSRIVGLIQNPAIDIRYGTKFCGKSDEAKLIPTKRDKDFTPVEGSNFFKNKDRESIKPLGTCNGSNLCSYVFMEK